MSVVRHWAVRASAGAALLAVVLLAVALYGWLEAGPGTETKIRFFFVDVVFVVALQVFSGNTGILSFGHMAFIGTGAYVAGILTADPLLKPIVVPGLPAFLETRSLDLFPTTLVAVGVAGALAVVTGLLVLRLDGTSAVIAILSLLLIAFVVFSGWQSVTGGQGGIYSFLEVTTVTWTFAWAVAAVFIARLFKESGTGLQLQGSREDPLAASAVGVRVRAFRLRAWVLSAMLAGAGGALFALTLNAITPGTFYLSRTFTIVVMLIVGGMTSVTGAVAGVGLVTVVQEVVRPYEDDSLDLAFLQFDRLTGLRDIALVAMILLVMYFRRDGLMGRRELDESLSALWRRVR
jgi:branched-chain amino acid transport system permease protein